MMVIERRHQKSSLFCLVCGVDSGPVLGFFVWFVGGALLAFGAIGLWGYLTGKFRANDSIAKIPLKLEHVDGGSNGNR